jgi:hypothetical protein
LLTRYFHLFLLFLGPVVSDSVVQTRRLDEEQVMAANDLLKHFPTLSKQKDENWDSELG